MNIHEYQAKAVLQAFADAGKAAKIDVDISADIERERWEKFCFLVAMAGSTAMLRSPIRTQSASGRSRVPAQASQRR